jgi:LacI family transcriptional regulator
MLRKVSARLSDVARAAGVSLSTASRALAEPDLVHPGTRERVRKAASMLGYVPHGAARALASSRSRTIGAVVPTVDNPIFASATGAIARTLAASSYTLLLAAHEYDRATEVAVTRALVERGVDGLVLVGIDHPPELYRDLERAGLPVELTWTLDGSGYHHCVGFSNRLAALRVTQHLLDLGHREFAVIAGHTQGNDRARERLAGVREALAANGIELAPARVVETEFSIGHGRAALRTLWERVGRTAFSALVCGNDLLAIGALLECGSDGVAVPGRLSIAGFDDIELSAELPPGLTTVHVPSAEIGRLAAEHLLARLAGRRVRRSEEVPAELVVRGTTASPPR